MVLVGLVRKEKKGWYRQVMEVGQMPGYLVQKKAAAADS